MVAPRETPLIRVIKGDVHSTTHDDIAVYMEGINTNSSKQRMIWNGAIRSEQLSSSNHNIYFPRSHS